MDTWEGIEFEHRFWLQILGDHLRFLEDALAPVEQERIVEAQALRQRADVLGEQITPGKDFAQKAMALAQEIHKYELRTLADQIHWTVLTSMCPTFLNHMVNETEEYLRIVSDYLTLGRVREESELPPFHHHQLWLIDAVGHADELKLHLDPLEKKTRKILRKTKGRLQDLYMTSQELQGYLRSGDDFPALEKFTDEVIAEIQTFVALLEKIYRGCQDHSLLGTVTVLLADHLIREESYYLIKIGQRAGLEMEIPYDPTTPRREGLV